MESLFFALALTFLLTYFYMPNFILRIKSSGYLIIDRYKPEKTELPTHGAVLVLFTMLLVCSITPVVFGVLRRLGFTDNYVLINEIDFAILFVILAYGIFGFIDELINIKWLSKSLYPIFFSFPLVMLLNPSVIEIPFYGTISLSGEVVLGFEYSDLFRIFVIPIYIMVVANLVNMHSGFNGLQSGLSVILLFLIILNSLLVEEYDNLLIPFSMLGGIFGLWFYNRFPAKIFEGNIGSLSFGASIGAILMVKEYYIFGIIILFPHIIDFLMLMYLVSMKKPFVKFGSLNDDGTINAPNPIKLKFLFPYFFSLTEKQVVNCCYILSLFFGIIGLAI